MATHDFPRRFGKYILLSRINSGGMAEVFRAKVTGAEAFQRYVAIKCMLPQLLEDKQFTTMFIDEAKLAAQLNHANIVQIYELGRIASQLYISMELVSGRDLRHIIKVARQQRRRLPLAFAAYVVSKAAEGLDFAHRKTKVDGAPLNLVHRDVSPQNILVSYDGEVKVVDFGIAKAEERATETRAGVLKGKFAYMAPEQVTGKGIDRRIDIFALGIILYEAVTGSRMFRGESDYSILEQVRDAEVPRLRDKVPDAPAELEQILAKALAKDRDQRYQYASELAEDLEPILIENRSIFGAKRAGQLMRELFADEVAQQAEQAKQDAAVVVADESAAAAAAAATTDQGQADWSLATRSGPVGETSSPSASRRVTPTFDEDAPDASARTVLAPMPSEPSQPSGARGIKPKPMGRVSTSRVDRGKVGAASGRPAGAMPRSVWLLVGLAASLLVAVIAIWVGRSTPRGGRGPTQLSARAASEPAESGNAKGYGHVDIVVQGMTIGRAFIDGVEAGYLPLRAHRLRVGKHQLKVVEETGGFPGRVVTREISVETTGTPEAPQLISVTF